MLLQEVIVGETPARNLFKSLYVAILKTITLVIDTQWEVYKTCKEVITFEIPQQRQI